MLTLLSARGYNSNTAKYLLNEHAPAAITRACGYLTNCKDFYKDFSSDFERSDPSIFARTYSGHNYTIGRVKFSNFN